ncbi:MAG: 4-hydroxy-tetrahydrodipicolinate reductase [Acidimicrobiales bacterium]
MNLQIGVLGASGRMGRTVCEAVIDDADLDLVAAVDPLNVGLDLRQVTGLPSDLRVSAAPSKPQHDGVEVFVDFTVRDAAMNNLRWCADNGVHAVVGTTGFSDEDLRELREIFVNSNCLVAANFAIGAVLMMRFAELAAPWFDSAEIIEMHHENKVDAPSGTAMATLARMREASDEWLEDPTRKQLLEGSRGGIDSSGIAVHSVRMRGLVAHQEVLLGTTGQSLTIRHDSYDRCSFMPGVLLAVKRIATLPGLTIGLEAALGI